MKERGPETLPNLGAKRRFRFTASRQMLSVGRGFPHRAAFFQFPGFKR